jgi:hypothetical protein
MPAGLGVLERLGLAETVAARRSPACEYHGFGSTSRRRFPPPRAFRHTA